MSRAWGKEDGGVVREDRARVLLVWCAAWGGDWRGLLYFAPAQKRRVARVRRRKKAMTSEREEAAPPSICFRAWKPEQKYESRYLPVDGRGIGGAREDGGGHHASST